MTAPAGVAADGATAPAAAAEQRDELIRRLEQKGRAFLRLARKTPDHAQADQLCRSWQSSAARPSDCC